MNIRDGNKVLEIGCGWGGFAEYLAKKHNVSIDCITISKNQFEFTKKRIFEANLNNKVNVKFLDYRDLKEKYDNIVSIEMIEAVGEKYLDQYFGTIKNVLNQNGTAAIQGIVIKEDLFKRYRGNEDFIQKYIFPGGFLPSLNFMKHLMKKNKLNFEKINTYSDDYARTLALGEKIFSGAWETIKIQGFDDYFKRMWEFYLSYCEGGFKSKNINLIQFSMSNKHFNEKIYSIIFLILTTGCANKMKPTDFKDQKPRLIIENYLSGNVKAWGVLQNRSGKVTRQFKADLNGKWDGSKLILNEVFDWNDGEKQTRQWTIKKIDEHNYEGTASDVVGTAKGYSYGPAFKFEYVLLVPVKGKNIKITFDDWIFMQDERVAINRATMTKFGIKVAELTVMFVKD